MNLFLYQIKQAYLSLKQKPGFVFSVVSTMGITLGALLCVLTLAYVMLFKPLPYPEQDRLYWAEHALSDESGKKVAGVFSYPGLIHFYDNQQVFSESALLCFGESILWSDPEQPSVNTTFVSPEIFSLLEMKMSLGRPFEASENKDTHNPVTVISYKTWQQDYNFDKNILDEKVTFNGVNFQIVGVLAESFIEPDIFSTGRKTEYWLPWDYNFKRALYHDGWAFVLFELAYIGKLKNDLSVEQAKQKVNHLLNDIWQENVSNIEHYKGWRVNVNLQTLQSVIIGENTSRILLLVMAVLGLLLIACANISNLYGARIMARQRVLAINAASGASKKQLFTYFFIESLLIMFLSAIVALLVSKLGFGLLQHYLFEFFPRVNELSLSGFTWIITLIFMLVLAILFSKIASRIINYQRLISVLQSGGKGTGVQVSKSLRQRLIIGQIVITTLLVLVNTNLFSRALATINMPMNYDIDNVVAVNLKQDNSLQRGGEESIALIKAVQKSLEELPVVEVVSQAGTPMSSYATNFNVRDSEEVFWAELQEGGDEHYLSVLNQPLIAGDWFTQDDVKFNNYVFIVNDVLAKQLAPYGDVIGMKISMQREIDLDKKSIERTIIGIVKGVNLPNKASNPPQVFRPIWQGSTSFLISTKAGQTLTRSQVVTAIEQVTKKFSLNKFESLAENRTKSLFIQYTTVITCALLTVISISLAAIGLYGVFSYSSHVRRFEIGTYMVIGAKGKDVVKLIIRDNASLLGIGFLISVLVLLGLFIGFEEQLNEHFHLSLLPLFMITLIIISLVSFLACYLPLRKYIKQPVIQSLRGSE